MARLWGHGFTKTKSLRGIGNPGLYLTAYLGDMELTEAIKEGRQSSGRLTESRDKSKAIVKGARLKLYPSSFNLFRHSRGVKLPEIRQTTEGEALAEVDSAQLTYEKTISLTDESGTARTVINYRTYTKTATDREAEEAGSGKGTP